MRGLQEKSTPPETLGHASRESAPLLLPTGLGDWENYFAPFDLRLEVGEDEKEYQKEYQETFTNITNISINMSPSPSVILSPHFLLSQESSGGEESIMALKIKWPYFTLI